ncbi:hypothetical protein [Clostridium sp.]|uniref:hypothetical protein n=1 Tax=Clostridium sp. TaxID=1506 RepID=UPI00262EAAD1|nr:hypothetical protein [Clostridium sp.]
MDKKSDLEQLSFFEHECDRVDKLQIQWDNTICDSVCMCSKCIKNCELHVSNTTVEEARTLDEPCWNCDECYFYGMDDETLSKNIVKFECTEFKMSKYYINLYAKKQRKKFKIISS